MRAQRNKDNGVFGAVEYVDCASAGKFCSAQSSSTWFPLIMLILSRPQHIAFSPTTKASVQHVIQHKWSTIMRNVKEISSIIDTSIQKFRSSDTEDVKEEQQK